MDGRQGAGIFVKRPMFIAAWVATAALACVGAAQASTANSSPPAPLRVAASPRHSAAGASATATHAVRSRHGHRHHRRFSAVKAQFRARVPWSAGASAPLPARGGSIPPRHAALRPATHDGTHARHRTSGPGAAALVAPIGMSPQARGIDAGQTDPFASRFESVRRGRGPPLGSMSPPPSPAATPVGLPSALTVPKHTSIPSQYSRHAPGGSLSAPLDACRELRCASSLSRDRLESRPHADRLEGAVACFGMPSSRRPS